MSETKRTELVTQHHFFISTVSGWVTGPDMITAIRRVRQPGLDVSYLAIWRVPLPEKAEYAIENFGPQVERAELIYLDNGGPRDHPDSEKYSAVGHVKNGLTISDLPEDVWKESDGE